MRSRSATSSATSAGASGTSARDYGDLPQAEDRTQYAIDLKQQYPPGRVWAYNNAAIQTLDRVISTATGQPTREYAAERLFGPIGMTHTQMTPDPAGNTNTFFGTQTTCQDLARFGYLFLRQGRWGDEQVVPRSWVKAAVGRPSQQHNAAYGLLWWLNRRGPIIGPLATDAPGQPEPPVGQTMPGMPASAFTAQGLGGQMVLVDPDSETVVVRIGQFQANPRGHLHRPGRCPVRHRGAGPSLAPQTASSCRYPRPRTPRYPEKYAARWRSASPRTSLGLGVVGLVLGQPARVPGGVPGLEDVPLVQRRLVHGQRCEARPDRQLGHLAERAELVVAPRQRRDRRGRRRPRPDAVAVHDPATAVTPASRSAASAAAYGNGCSSSTGAPQTCDAPMQITRSHPPCRSSASLTRRSTLSARPRVSARPWPCAIATASRSTPSPMASGARSSTRSSSSAQPQPMSSTRAGVAVGQEGDQP